MNHRVESLHPAGIHPDRPNASAIEALFARLRGPLRRFFERRDVPSHEVEDLVQQVFLRLTGRADLTPLERPEAYLFTTASNLLRDRHRRRSARAADAHEPYDEVVHGGLHMTPGPERELLGTQRVEQLVAALYDLPERTRVVFTLYHLEGLSHETIARRLGIAVSTIEKHMARAIAHCLGRLDRP